MPAASGRVGNARSFPHWRRLLVMVLGCSSYTPHLAAPDKTDLVKLVLPHTHATIDAELAAAAADGGEF
jgi:hypothetical protein